MVTGGDQGPDGKGRSKLLSMLDGSGYPLQIRLEHEARKLHQEQTRYPSRLQPAQGRPRGFG